MFGGTSVVNQLKSWDFFWLGMANGLPTALGRMSQRYSLLGTALKRGKNEAVEAGILRRSMFPPCAYATSSVAKGKSQ